MPRISTRHLLVGLTVGLVSHAPEVSAQSTPVAGDPTVEPGDKVALLIWNEPDITGEFLVDQHYLLTLPFIGEIDVRGETELSLRERVRRELRRDIRNPSIEVFLLKRVRILGPVIEPGLVYVNGTMSVADALASVGGRTLNADLSTVILRRDGVIIQTNILQDTRLSELAIRTGDEIFVPEKAWLDRNAGAVITGITGAIGIVIGLLIR